MSSWSGLPVKALRPAVERLGLARLRDADGRMLFDLPDVDVPSADTPAPVRFLPTWDAMLLVHARPSNVLPEPYRPRIFRTTNPHSVGTVLVDGAVAGSWRHEAGQVVVEPFEPLTAAVRREVAGEAERLAAFHT